MPASAAATAPATVAGAKLKVPKVIADKVQWINDNVAVQEKLRLGAVARSLIEVGKDSALEILDGLVADVDNVWDPNAWVVEAAAAHWDTLAKEQDARKEAEAEGAAWEASMALLDMGEGDPLPEVPERVRTRKRTALERLHQLNERGVLQEGSVKRLKPFPTEKIDAFGSHFKLLGQAQSEKLVDKLCKRALQLERPLDWLDNQARSALGEVVWTVAKTCSSGNWAEPLDPFGAKALVRTLPAEQAVTILTELQKQAKRIPHPLVWLRQESRKRLVTMLPEDTIKRIKLLNSWGRLLAPLNVTRIKPAMFKLSAAKQLEVLDYLKKRATDWNIADPNTFVEQACQRAKEQEATPRTLSEATVQQVEWLNEHAELAEELDIERLRPHLCMLEEEQHAQIFERLKSGDAAEMVDPNTFVIKECKRLAKPGGLEDKGGTKRKRLSEEEDGLAEERDEEEEWDEGPCADKDAR